MEQKLKTILVVDDDVEVLRFVSACLVNTNFYIILTANSGTEALQVSRGHDGEIHLLLTDFQMPGMSGIALGTEMTIERPKLKVLMMSGFTDGMLILNEGWHFLAKPFIPSQLRSIIVGLISPAFAQHAGSVPGDHPS